jgi:alkylation response protein AidB-like acyl-CoA dehydrogenase
MDGLLAGGVIGLPPVLNFGSPELQAKIVPDVLAGKKFICLAISEAFAGSDVGGMQTYAYKDGNEWVISGTKKYGFVFFYCTSQWQARSLLMRSRTDG